MFTLLLIMLFMSGASALYAWYWCIQEYRNFEAVMFGVIGATAITCGILIATAG